MVDDSCMGSNVSCSAWLRLSCAQLALATCSAHTTALDFAMATCVAVTSSWMINETVN